MFRLWIRSAAGSGSSSRNTASSAGSLNRKFRIIRLCAAAWTGSWRTRWEAGGIGHRTLLKVERYQAGSVFVSQALDEWMEKVPVLQRQQFVDDFFAALAADGSHTMVDIAAKGPPGFENVPVHMIRMEPSSRTILWKLPLTALPGSIPERIRNWKVNAFLESETGKAVLILLTGILCVVGLLQIVLGLKCRRSA